MSARFTHPFTSKDIAKEWIECILVTKYHCSSYCLHYTNWKGSNHTWYHKDAYHIMMFVEYVTLFCAMQFFAREGKMPFVRNLHGWKCQFRRFLDRPLRKITVYLVLLGHLELFLSLLGARLVGCFCFDPRTISYALNQAFSTAVFYIYGTLLSMHDLWMLADLSYFALRKWDGFQSSLTKRSGKSVKAGGDRWDQRDQRDRRDRWDWWDQWDRWYQWDRWDVVGKKSQVLAKISVLDESGFLGLPDFLKK